MVAVRGKEMEQQHLNLNLFEEVTSRDGLRAGYRAVKRNSGAAGVDGVTVEAFGVQLEEELKSLHAELREWRYTPQPVRRVLIPKAGGKKTRKLGIPTVRDRVVQASMKLKLEPLFEKEFSPNSYGFRPGRSQR